MLEFINKEGWIEVEEDAIVPIKSPSKETVSVNSFRGVGRAGSI